MFAQWALFQEFHVLYKRAPFLNEILGLLVKFWCGSCIHSIHQNPWILSINLEHTLQYFTNNAYTYHREFEIRQIVSKCLRLLDA